MSVGSSLRLRLPKAHADECVRTYIASFSMRTRLEGRDASTANGHRVRAARSLLSMTMLLRVAVIFQLPGAVDGFAGDHGPQDFGVAHFFGAYGQDVAIQQN